MQLSRLPGSCLRATAAPWVILSTQIPDKNKCSRRGTGCGWCLVDQAREETKSGGFGFLILEEVSKAKTLKTCCHALRAGNFVVLSSYLQRLTGCHHYFIDLKAKVHAHTHAHKHTVSRRIH